MKWAKPQFKQKRKLTAVVLVAVLAILIVPIINPATANAAEWVNQNTIKHAGLSFKKEAGSNTKYSSGDCTYIEFNNPPDRTKDTKATYHQGGKLPNGTCSAGNNSNITVPAAIGLPSGNGSGGNESVDEGAGAIECFGGVEAFNPLNWVFCPLANIMSSAVSLLDGKINDWLCVNQKVIFGEGNVCGEAAGEENTAKAFHQAWNVFRVFALGLIAIAGLVMIIAQAAGLEIFDAYSIRKVLPRLLVAAIGVSLSWEILQFLVALSNVLGMGVRSIIYAPFLQAGLDLNIHLGGVSESLGGIALLGSLAVLGIFGLLSFIGTALLAVLIAFIVLAFRNILIFVLVILAPLAIAAYVLPNTQKIWKLWWNWLFMALMAFPIIMAFIAAGRVFAGVASAAGGVSNQIMAFFAYVLPYFLLPFAFRLAGGAMATIGGLVNDRSRGGFDRLKGYRKQKGAQNWENIKEGKRFSGGTATNFRGKLNRGMQYGTMLPETRGNLVRARERVRGATRNQSFDSAMKGLQENSDMVAIAPDDTLLEAGLRSKGDEKALRRHFEKTYGDQVREGKMTEDQAKRKVQDDTASVSRAVRSMGWDDFAIAATVAKAGTKSGYEAQYDDQGRMIEGTGANQQLNRQIKAVAEGDEALASRMLAASGAQAGRAGRLDLTASFGSRVGELQKVMRGGEADEAKLLMDVFNNNDAVSLGRGDSRSTRNIATTVQQRIHQLDSTSGQRDSAVAELLSRQSTTELSKEDKDRLGQLQKEQRELGQLAASMENWKQTSTIYAAPQRVQTISSSFEATHNPRTNVQQQVASTPETRTPEGLPTGSPTVQGYREQQPARGRFQDPNIDVGDRDEREE